MGNMNDHISTNIHTYKYIKGSMGKWYSYSTKWEENIVVSLHIYEARTIFLLIYDFLSWPRHWIWVIGNINEHVSNNIHTYKYIKDSMRQLYPYSTKREENIVAILHIDGAKAIFLLFYDDRDTGSK